MIPAVLRKLDVLVLAEPLVALIDSGTAVLPKGATESELRAAALVACDRIAAASGGRFTALELDYYLWTIGVYDAVHAIVCRCVCVSCGLCPCGAYRVTGKEPEYRSVQRHATTDTIFY